MLSPCNALFQVPSLSLTEFACAPQLSPTSMYLTAPRGKDVSLVCRVTADPVGQVEWFFRGRRIQVEEQEGQEEEVEALPQTDRNGERVRRLIEN